MLQLLIQSHYHKESIQSVALLRLLVLLTLPYHLLLQLLLLPLSMVGIQPALVVLRLQLVVLILLQIFKLVQLTPIVANNGPILQLELSRYIHNGLMAPLLYLLSLELVAPVVGVLHLLLQPLLMHLVHLLLQLLILHFMVYV